MEDPYVNYHWPTNSYDELSSLAAAFGENLHNSFYQPMHDIKPSPEASCTFNDRPLKQLKSNSWSSESTIDHTSYTQATYSNSTSDQFASVKPKDEVLAFKSVTALPSHFMTSQGSFEQNYVLKPSQGAKRISTSARLSQAQDHIMAERKRREKLSQRFIALSALVPGLKKVLVSLFMFVLFNFLGS